MTLTPPEAPDQGPEHNPDGLTPEQYGAPEWRLLRVGEITEDGDQCDVSPDGTDWRVQLEGLEIIPEFRCTYRRRVAPEPEQARNNALNKMAYEQSGEPRTPEQRIAELERQLAEAREAREDFRERNKFHSDLAISLSQKLGDAKTQLAASEKDRERLDWLERIDHQKQLFGNWIGGGGTLRAAIDATMKEAAKSLSPRTTENTKPQ